MRYLFWLLLTFCVSNGFSQGTYDDEYQHGLDLAESGHYEEAIKRFNIFIYEVQIYPDAYYNRGFCRAKIGDWENAKKDLDTAIMLKPDKQSQPYHWRGMAQTELGNYDAAIADFTKAIEILGAPERSNIAGRARAYLKKQDYYSALKDFNLAIEFVPDELDLYLGRAYCNYYLKNMEKVLPDLEKYLAENPETADALEMAMRTSFELKDRDKAFHYADRYAELPIVGYMGDLFKASIYLSEGKVDKALASLNTAINKNGTYAEAYYTRGVCYTMLKQMDNACNDFQKAMSLGYTSIKEKVESVCQ